MSESRFVQPAAPSSATPPHDLLARLYREIGISAVAAALQVHVDKPEASAHTPKLPKAPRPRRMMRRPPRVDEVA